MPKAKPRAKRTVTDRGHVEIDGVDYEPGDDIPTRVKIPRWLVDQGYVSAGADD